jgi:hypothetical protein
VQTKCQRWNIPEDQVLELSRPKADRQETDGRVSLTGKLTRGQPKPASDNPGPGGLSRRPARSRNGRKCVETWTNERDPRDVAAGVRVARDETWLNGEGDVREHDGDRGRRLLGRSGRLPARGAEDIHRETNQLYRELGKTLDTPIGPAGLDGDVLAFNVTERP